MKKTIAYLILPLAALVLVAAGTQISGPVTTSRAARQLLTNETTTAMRSFLGVGTNAELYDLSDSTNLMFSGLDTTTKATITNIASESAAGAVVAVGPEYDLKFKDGIDAASVNAQSLKRVRVKIYNNQKVTLSFLGDSVGADVQPAVETALLQFMGRSGAVAASSGTALGNYYVTESATGTSTPYAVGLSGVFWGPFSTLGNGAVFTYGSSISNGVAGDSIGVAYYQSSGFGTMLVETQRVSGSWGTLTTLSSSGGAGLTMATTNISVPFASDYKLRITSTGSNIPVATAIRDTRSGVGFISSSTTTPGNPPLSFMLAAGSNNVAKFLLWQNPDVVFYKAERIDSDTNNIPWFHTLLTNTLPTCDMVLVSYHRNTDADESRRARDFYVLQANARGLAFADGYAESLSYSNSIANGLYQSDHTHLEDVGRLVVHSRLMSQLGLGFNELLTLRRGYSDTSKAGLASNNSYSGVNAYSNSVRSFLEIVARAGSAIGVWNESDDQQTIWKRIGNHLVWQDSISLYTNVMSLSNNTGNLMFDLPSSFGPPKVGWANPFSVAAANILLSSNAISAWPSAPSRAGDALLVKSNDTVYLLNSGNSASWISTNPVISTFVYGTNIDFVKVTTQVGDAALSWPFMQLADSNTPPELFYRPNSMSGGAEGNRRSFTQTQRGQAPRGYSTWNAFGTNYNGTQLTNVLLAMSTNGMVRNGYNWITFDEGYGYVASTPGSTAFDGSISKWDAVRFPGGAKGVVDFAHSLGIKCMIYGGPVPYGPAGCYVWGGTNLTDLALNVSNYINYIGIDGFKWEGGAAGNVHQLVNEINKWSKPVWINVAASTNHHTWTSYEPWMADTVNSWRPGVGYGNIGDINGRPDRLYQWADVANFSMIRPGHVVNFDLLGGHPAYWGIDIPEIKQAGTKYTGSLNILAMMAMANSEIWMSSAPTPYEHGAHRYASYYTDYDNPLINRIQGDLTKPMWQQSSNYLAVQYGKWLSDGSLAVLVQNRSTTNKTEVINFDDYFGNFSPIMVESTNRNICTVRDVMRNVTLGYYTNSYSATISPTNIAWLQITKGIVEHYTPGTNYISDYGWMYSTNYPDNNPGMCANYTYLPYGSGKIFINSTVYDHGFYSSHGNFVRLKYALNKQADFFSATAWNRFNGANCGVNIYTNDVLATTVLMPVSGSVSNILVGVTNADTMIIEITNATATLAFVLADPLIYCRGQTKVDEQGRQIRLLDKSYVDAAFTAAATPNLAGSGMNITNVGEAFIFFDSLPNNGFNRINGSSPSPNGTLFAGFAGSGASTRRCNVFVPGWVTNAIFYGMKIESSAVSTWTNLIEPSFYASDGKFVGSGSGLNSSNEVCMITAAGGVSNYTFTVKWPATNVNVKGFQMSFLTATNTSATHYIGPVMKVRYNP